jgi:acylphosphatase
MPNDSVRYQITLHGTVQGVGLRVTTRTLAMQYSLKGFVRNTTDGAVEIVVEGPSTSLINFLSDVKHQFRMGITRCELRESRAMGQFTRFDVFS